MHKHGEKEERTMQIYMYIVRRNFEVAMIFRVASD